MDERMADLEMIIGPAEQYYGNFDDKLLDIVKGAEKINPRNGGFGTGSEIHISSKSYYLKEIKKTFSKITDNEQFIKEMTNIQKEILINLDVTEKIPEYVSKCIGAYTCYYIRDNELHYNIYVLFEYLKGFPLNSYLEKYSSMWRNSTFIYHKKLNY